VPTRWDRSFSFSRHDVVAVLNFEVIPRRVQFPPSCRMHVAGTESTLSGNGKDFKITNNQSTVRAGT
jgi:hypothetical protein